MYNVHNIGLNRLICALITNARTLQPLVAYRYTRDPYITVALTSQEEPVDVKVEPSEPPSPLVRGKGQGASAQLDKSSLEDATMLLEADMQCEEDRHEESVRDDVALQAARAEAVAMSGKDPLFGMVFPNFDSAAAFVGGHAARTAPYRCFSTN